MKEDPERRKLKPSRMAMSTGYRTDSERHREARMKVPAKRRRRIAMLGGLANLLKQDSDSEEILPLIIRFLESKGYKVTKSAR
jgi:hypothetical protein